MPVATNSALRVKRFIVWFTFLVMAGFWTVLCLGPCTLYAQTIAIKVVNGHNGKPLADKCMYVWIGNKLNYNSGPLFLTQTNAAGIINVRLAPKGVKIDIGGGHRLTCGLTGFIAPIAKLGDTISVNTGYVSCGRGVRNYSWLSSMDFPVSEVLRQGIVSENTCGKATALPVPGEIVIFVRPLTMWEKLMQ